MKLTRVEQMFDGSRLIFYYTAEGRVDFRELVRDLAAHFRTRIEMRQIGVRDEARMLGGYGSCGRPLCCTTWLQTFEPVSIKMAKLQNLSLNPSKLSGMCGRLKCCLRYELPNGKGVTHGGCADEGGCGSCSNPTGPGGRLRILCERRLRPASMTMRPRVGITVGDPAGIGPEIATKAAQDPRVTAACEPILYGPHSRDQLAAFARGRISPEAGRAAYDAIESRRRRRAERADSRDRHRADQQGSILRRRSSLAGPHRAAGAPDRRAPRRDDVLLRKAARRAGNDPHAARARPASC